MLSKQLFPADTGLSGQRMGFVEKQHEVTFVQALKGQILPRRLQHGKGQIHLLPLQHTGNGGYVGPMMIQGDIRTFQQELLKQPAVVCHTGNRQRFGRPSIQASDLPHSAVNGGQSQFHMVQKAFSALVQNDLAPAAFNKGTPTSSSKREMEVLRLGWETNMISAAFDIFSS